MNRTQINKSLQLYTFLARRKRPKSYLGKILLVAFVGTHIPLLTLFFYAISTTNLTNDLKIRILIIALIATLIGTAATLLALQQLLLPITVTFRSLRHYLEYNTLPNLPTGFKDEAGILMADTMYAIAKLDESIHQLKHYDPLTALPNRELFQHQLENALSGAKQKHQVLAIALLDLDNFSAFNNSLGPEKGDSILRQVAYRLSNSLDDNDILSRLGNDEFAMLHQPFTSVEDISTYYQKLLHTLAKPIHLNGDKVYTTASIGIALYPTDEDQAEQLMTHADIALRSAKEQGQNTYRFYSSEMNEQLCQRLELERDLRGALEREELELFFQPQIDLNNRGYIGAEVLLRWQHPKHGFVSPGRFIPIAESSGLIIPIGEWVLHKACKQNKIWQTAGYPQLRVAVNLSAPQFQQPDLIELVSKTLKNTHHDPHCLELEITEGLLMDDVENAIAVLNNLQHLGITIALDDFGTGYSSLSYLKRFPINYLKIDQSFVRGIPGDGNDEAIVRSVIALAQSLQLEVIAEGVETQEQADYLQQQGCYTLQGYYFGRPMPAQDFVAFWEKTFEG